MLLSPFTMPLFLNSNALSSVISLRKIHRNYRLTESYAMQVVTNTVRKYETSIFSDLSKYVST